jgi:hypothetical protein
MAEISPLRRRMIEDMTVRNLSPATQHSAQLLTILRTYWRLTRPKRWLFPAATTSVRSYQTYCTPPAVQAAHRLA